MKIILDKNMETEAVFEARSFYEHPLENRLNASSHIKVMDSTVFPVISLPGKFSTIDVISDGIQIPLNGIYNVVEDINISYIEEDKIYNVSVAFSKGEEQ